MPIDVEGQPSHLVKCEFSGPRILQFVEIACAGAMLVTSTTPALPVEVLRACTIRRRGSEAIEQYRESVVHDDRDALCSNARRMPLVRVTACARKTQ